MQQEDSTFGVNISNKLPAYKERIFTQLRFENFSYLRRLWTIFCQELVCQFDIGETFSCRKDFLIFFFTNIDIFSSSTLQMTSRHLSCCSTPLFNVALAYLISKGGLCLSQGYCIIGFFSVFHLNFSLYNT